MAEFSGFGLPIQKGDGPAFEQTLQAPPVVRLEVRATQQWFESTSRQTRQQVGEAIADRYQGVIQQFIQGQRQNYLLSNTQLWRKLHSVPGLDIEYTMRAGFETIVIAVYPENAPVVTTGKELTIPIGIKNIDIIWNMPGGGKETAPPSWAGGTGATYKVPATGKIYFEFQIVAYDNTNVIAPPVPGYRGAQSPRVGLMWDTENVENPAYPQRVDGPINPPGPYRSAVIMGNGEMPYRSIIVMGIKATATFIDGIGYYVSNQPGGDVWLCNDTDPGATGDIHWYRGQYVGNGSTVFVVDADGVGPVVGPPDGAGNIDGSPFMYGGVQWRRYSAIGAPNQIPVYDNYYYRWTMNNNTGELIRKLLYMIWHADGGVEYFDFPELNPGEVLSGATTSDVIEVGTQNGPSISHATATSNGDVSGDVFQDFNGNPPTGSIPVNNTVGNFIAIENGSMDALNETTTNPQIPYASNPVEFGMQAGMFISTQEGTVKAGDTIMCAYEVPAPDPLDPDKVKSGGRVWLGYNGIWMNGGNPANLSSPCAVVDAPPRGYDAMGDYPAFSTGYMPAVTWLWNSSGHVRITLNPGDWKYKAPVGFEAAKFEPDISIDLPV